LEFRTNKKGNKYPINARDNQLDPKKLDELTDKITKILDHDGLDKNGNVIDYKKFYKKERLYEKENPLPTERQPSGFGELTGLVDPPVLEKEIPFGKDERSGFRRNLLDDSTMIETEPSFKTDGNKITPPEGLQMKSPYNPKRNATTGLPERKSPRQSDWTRIISAEKGFNGIVKKETTFKVAEHDKPEFVSVVPLDDDDDDWLIDPNDHIPMEVHAESQDPYYDEPN